MTAMLAVAVLGVVAYSLLLQGERLSAASADETAGQMASASAPDNARLAGAYRFQRGGWTYVHLQGTPDQIGYQHGYLLASEIKDAFAAVKLEDTHKTKHNWNFFRDAAQNALLPHIDAEYQAELKGIVAGLNARGVKMDLYDVVALNAFEELPDYYAPWYDDQHKVTGAPHQKVIGHCSAFVATGSWTKDHGIVIAHNNWTDYMEGERWRVIFDIQPEHGYRMIGDGFPGVIVSDDDFTINSDGLMVTETTISAFHGWNPDGIPEFVRARKAMQYAGSIDDYVKIMLDGNNGGYANDWLIGDRKTGEIAQFELGLKAYKVWRTKDGYFVGANFTSDPTVTKLDTTFDVHDAAMSPNARHVRWDELMKQNKGKIDVQLAERFEGDHFDAYTKKRGADVRTLCGHGDAMAKGDPGWDVKPYDPMGAVQGKVTDSAMAAHMELIARAGHPCGANFYAKPFLAQHPEYDWQAPELRDMIAGPWTEFQSGQKPASSTTPR
jgi:Phospholipase B